MTVNAQYSLNLHMILDYETDPDTFDVQSVRVATPIELCTSNANQLQRRCMST